MPHIKFIESTGKEHLVTAVDERTLMQAAVDNGVPGIIGECGGSCSCGTCHGFIDERWLDALLPISPDEEALLDGLILRQANSRLTCQIRVTQDLDQLIVRLPKSQL